MGGSFVWGAFAASSLLIGALIALRFRISPWRLGIVMAFGAGVLISAVAFDLVEDAYNNLTGGSLSLALGLLAGSVAFFLGDRLIDQMGAADRKSPTGADEEGNALAIVLGAVLDGVPESIVIGVNLMQGEALGVAYILAVFLSNLPEGMAATTGLRQSGWRTRGIIGLWSMVVLAAGLASLGGYLLLKDATPTTIGFVQTFAAGAILTMLADTMMPEAYAHSRKVVGLVTTFGFAVAYAIHVLE
jgi:ZIP family zinc transporter